MTASIETVFGAFYGTTESTHPPPPKKKQKKKQKQTKAVQLSKATKTSDVQLVTATPH